MVKDKVGNGTAAKLRRLQSFDIALMFGNVADLIQEGVTSDSLLDKSAQVGRSVTSHAVVIVEDAETHEDAAEAVTQPLRLVVLVGADLVENEGERVGGGEEESHSLRTSSNPGTEQLQQAKSSKTKGIRLI